MLNNQIKLFFVVQVMKTYLIIFTYSQIVVGCLSVCASAAPFYGLVAHPNGAVVPADEPAVAAARAEHLSAKGVVAHAAYAAPAVAAPVAHAAYAAPAVAAPVAHATYAAAPVAPAAYAAVPAVAHGYTGPLNLNTQLVGHPNGAVVPGKSQCITFYMIGQ